MIGISRSEWYKLQKDFIEKFPIDSLLTLPIEKYTNLNRSDSLCYWLESETYRLGSIWGGSSYKFGIYKYDNMPKNDSSPHDEEYTWNKKLGDTRETAYNKILSGLSAIAKAAAIGDFEAIEKNTIYGEACKWKLAFIYSGMKLIPIYSKDMLQKLAKEYGMKDADSATMLDMQRFFLVEQGDEDIYDFYNNLLKAYDSLKAESNVWMLKGDASTFKSPIINMGDSVSAGLTDYSNFKTRVELGDAYRKVKNNTDVRVPYSYWHFIKEVKIGDIIVVFETRVKNKTNSHLLYGWGIITSDLMNDIDSDNPLQRQVEWKNILDNPIEDNKTKNSMFFHGTTKEQAENIKTLLNITFQDTPNNQVDNMNQYQSDIINLLLENHNLVLTGAPGTGKTFLAKEIAKAMGCSVERKNFVQFHPSYDYTDFVEGMRPTQDGHFERKDGVFKSFCKHALLQTAKSEDALFEDMNDDPKIWKVSLAGTGDNPIRRDCIDNNHIRIGWEKYGDADFSDFENYIEGGKTILKAFQNEMQVGDIVISCYGEYLTDAIGIITGDYEYNASGGEYPRYRAVKWLLKDVRIDTKELIGKRMTLSTIYKLSCPINRVIECVKKNTGTTTTEKKQPQVFIIDEINRGELSKIFGELFFAIDPGYRGEKGKVQTQYQNLIDSNDVFAEGFYVPENVYIIATMNDIDRSVESMDFAVRRRFTWLEVDPTDRIEMLDGLGENKQRAIEKMNNLNAVISQEPGLGAAFQIGPAYFLKLKEGNFEALWKMNLNPLLKEYLRGFRNADSILEKFGNAYNI